VFAAGGDLGEEMMPHPDGMVGFLKLNYQALFGTSLDP